MKTNRKELLARLELLAPGLDRKETIEQSDCYVFSDGRVASFNEEISCSAESPLPGISGAVKAAPLLELLGKLDDEDVDLEAADGELRVKTKKRRRSGIAMEAEILLPVAEVELPEEDAWKPLPPAFAEAVAVVKGCCSKDESVFVLTCVHLTPEWVEACDNFQAARQPLKLPLSAQALIKRASASAVAEGGAEEVAETANWLHFRSASGLVVSCRRYAEQYPNLDGILDCSGKRTTLPSGLGEATEKAEIFSADNPDANQVEIQLKAGKLKLRGAGASGWYEEVRDVKYDGDPIRFLIDPKLLTELCRRTSECEIGEGRLKIDGGSFTFVACLGEVE